MMKEEGEVSGLYRVVNNQIMYTEITKLMCRVIDSLIKNTTQNSTHLKLRSLEKGPLFP